MQTIQNQKLAGIVKFWTKAARPSLHCYPFTGKFYVRAASIISTPKNITIKIEREKQC